MSEQKASDKTPDEIAREIVRRLHNIEAHKWSIQDKGVLLAAVKLQLSGRGENAP